MMILYKFTFQNDKAYNGRQWGECVTHEVDGQGEIYSEHWIYTYRDPLLGSFFHSVAYLKSAHLWKGKGEIDIDDGLYVGCSTFTTLERLEMPPITLEQRVRFAILVSLEVYIEPTYVAWAKIWLSNKDHSLAMTKKAWTAAAARATMEATPVMMGTGTAWIAREAVEAARYAIEAKVSYSKSADQGYALLAALKATKGAAKMNKFIDWAALTWKAMESCLC